MLKTYGGETGIRTLGTLTRTPVFKTGALNQLDHLSRYYFLPASKIRTNTSECCKIIYENKNCVNIGFRRINPDIFFLLFYR